MNEKSPTPTQFAVVDRDGERATMDTSVAPPAGIAPNFVLLRFMDGSTLYADAGLFAMTSNAPGVPLTYAGSFAEMRRDSKPLAASSARAEQNSTTDEIQNLTAPQNETRREAGDEMVVPIIEEQLRVGREQVVTGGVRVHKTVAQHTETVDQPVFQEQISVEHVPINRIVEQAPEVRQEGDTLVVPLVEEVIVVEKRIVLREEIRITKRTVEARHHEEIVLRREDARLEEIEPDARMRNQNQ